ncbi:HTTM domain-containing protein [Sneathiella sp.]|jgi:hypothetical protein|uniref:HTTM domain-containing protein n=1 Tax=Sneathiella sp. TaxID=1964365 RepID=UPI0039E59929
MTLDFAVRATEILLGLAFLQQSIEYLLSNRRLHLLFLARVGMCLLLISGFQTGWVLVGLAVLSLGMLYRFDGPYNGGSDRMSLLVLACLLLVHFLPESHWQELAFGYLAVQLVLSYFISGWVKIVNPAWRNGRALQDVFLYSAYPVSESLRAFAARPTLLFGASWMVMLFELIFPFSLLTQPSLIAGLLIAALFHFLNACFFGLNRFFWIWLAAYPSIIWLQGRLFGGSALLG